MKKSILTLMVVLATFLFSSAAFSGVEFLRGNQEIDAPSKAPDKRKQEIVKGAFDRSYKIQPPMIPHKIDKEEINLKVNTCMKCHSAKTYKAKKAPKAGDSHYVTRDGKTLEKVASRRYFCNQCHALQLNAAPLVENSFVGAK
ncbi:MAG: nitrate reductase cytochrome c-type subunit [Sedimenticola sp.]